jgi:adenylosuccinate lyase
VLNVSGGLVVHPDVIQRNVEQVFPFMATENLLMAAGLAGGDRQELHEVIRRHSQAVTADLKAGGSRNDLLDRLRADPAFAKVDFDRVLDEGYFTGRAPEQVDEFIREEVEPVRERYRPLLGQTAEVTV